MLGGSILQSKSSHHHCYCGGCIASLLLLLLVLLLTDLAYKGPTKEWPNIRILVGFVKPPPPLGFLGLIVLTFDKFILLERHLNLVIVHGLTEPQFKPGVVQPAQEFRSSGKLKQ